MRNGVIREFLSFIFGFEVLEVDRWEGCGISKVFKVNGYNNFGRFLIRIFG